MFSFTFTDTSNLNSIIQKLYPFTKAIAASLKIVRFFEQIRESITQTWLNTEIFI